MVFGSPRPPPVSLSRHGTSSNLWLTRTKVTLLFVLLTTCLLYFFLRRPSVELTSSSVISSHGLVNSPPPPPPPPSLNSQSIPPHPSGPASPLLPQSAPASLSGNPPLPKPIRPRLPRNIPPTSPHLWRVPKRRSPPFSSPATVSSTLPGGPAPDARRIRFTIRSKFSVPLLKHYDIQRLLPPEERDKAKVTFHTTLTRSMLSLLRQANKNDTSNPVPEDVQEALTELGVSSSATHSVTPSSLSSLPTLPPSSSSPSLPLPSLASVPHALPTTDPSPRLRVFVSPFMKGGQSLKQPLSLTQQTDSKTTDGSSSSPPSSLTSKNQSRKRLREDVKEKQWWETGHEEALGNTGGSDVKTQDGYASTTYEHTWGTASLDTMTQSPTGSVHQDEDYPIPLREGTEVEPGLTLLFSQPTEDLIKRAKGKEEELLDVINNERRQSSVSGEKVEKGSENMKGKRISSLPHRMFILDTLKPQPAITLSPSPSLSSSSSGMTSTVTLSAHFVALLTPVTSQGLTEDVPPLPSSSSSSSSSSTSSSSSPPSLSHNNAELNRLIHLVRHSLIGYFTRASQSASHSSTLPPSSLRLIRSMPLLRYLIPSFVATTALSHIQSVSSSSSLTSPLGIPPQYLLVFGVDSEDALLNNRSVWSLISSLIHKALYSATSSLLASYPFPPNFNHNQDIYPPDVSILVYVSGPRSSSSSPSPSSVSSILSYSNLNSHTSPQSHKGSPSWTVNQLARSVCLLPSDALYAYTFTRHKRVQTNHYRSLLSARSPMASGCSPQKKAVEREWRRWQGAMADFIFQVNDDVELTSVGWANHLINKLQVSEDHSSNPHINKNKNNHHNDNTSTSQNNNNIKSVNPTDSLPFSHFGITGPKDINMPRLFTQAFAPCLHVGIYGTLFHPIAPNWFSDDSLTVTYGDAFTYKQDCSCQSQPEPLSSTPSSPSSSPSPSPSLPTNQHCSADCVTALHHEATVGHRYKIISTAHKLRGAVAEDKAWLQSFVDQNTCSGIQIEKGFTLSITNNIRRNQ